MLHDYVCGKKWSMRCVLVMRVVTALWYLLPFACLLCMCARMCDVCSHLMFGHRILVMSICHFLPYLN